MGSTRRRGALAVSISIVFAVVLAPYDGRSSSAQSQYPDAVLHFADLVLYNGSVLTADRDDTSFSVHEAVAVRDGKILAVGDSTTIVAMAGTKTRKIDLDGKTLVPGFIDTHADNHFIGGDWATYTQVGDRLISGDRDLLGWGEGAGRVNNAIRARTLEEGIANIKRIAALAKPGEPVFITLPSSYPIEMRYWTHKDVDKVVADNPLSLGIAGHLAITNTAMMNLAFEKGLRSDQFGVVKDDKGQPTGQFFQKANGFIITELRPWPGDVEPLITELKTINEDYLKVGVTSLVGHSTGLDMLALNIMYHRGELPLRYFTSINMRMNVYADSLLKRIGNLVDFNLGGMVKIPGAHVSHPDISAPYPEGMLTREPRKVIPGLPLLRGDKNGTGENVWAATSWTGKYWEDLTDDEKLATDWGTIIQARRYGWSMSGVHNTGSRAVEIFLGAIARAENQEGIISPRYRPYAIDHNIVWDDISIAAAAKLKGAVNFSLKYEPFLQRTFDGKKDVTYALYGEKLHNMQPVQELLAKGIGIHLEGADPWRVPPVKRMKWYVTREDDKGRVWGLKHAVDRKTVLLMVTRWAARYMGEQTIGSIEPGKMADMAVLDGDFLRIPEDKIDTLKVAMTIVGGKVVYERSGNPGPRN